MKTIIFAASATNFFCGNSGSFITEYSSYKKKLELAHQMKKNSSPGFVEKVFCCPASAWTQKVCEMGLEEFNEWANTQERLL